MAHLRGSIFIPVRLLINEQEHLKRVVKPERKSSVEIQLIPKYVYDKEPLLSVKHPYLMELNVSKLSAGKASKEIVKHIIPIAIINKVY